ncbi:MAG TPA: SWIM zinc finger family protein [Herpetosiphonaceae bacterium]|nr:SWIM zinc finger family protein [Herpetosiphonaceae bacterium]
MPLPQISEVDIKRLAGQTIAERGRRYYRDGQVVDAVLRGDLLHAQVRGSEYDPYQVSIRFAGTRLASAVCSCPYDGAVCKHMAAALFVLALQPDAVEERPPLNATLDELSADQLRALLLDVAAQHPDVADLLDGRISRLDSDDSDW